MFWVSTVAFAPSTTRRRKAPAFSSSLRARRRPMFAVFTRPSVCNPNDIGPNWTNAEKAAQMTHGRPVQPFTATESALLSRELAGHFPIQTPACTFLHLVFRFGHLPRQRVPFRALDVADRPVHNPSSLPPPFPRYAFRVLLSCSHILLFPTFPRPFPVFRLGLPAMSRRLAGRFLSCPLIASSRPLPWPGLVSLFGPKARSDRVRLHCASLSSQTGQLFRPMRGTAGCFATTCGEWDGATAQRRRGERNQAKNRQPQSSTPAARRATPSSCLPLDGDALRRRQTSSWPSGTF